MFCSALTTLKSPHIFLIDMSFIKLTNYRYFKNLDIDLDCVGRFLVVNPKRLIAEYPGRIINIHPALLPKYGGKGMYGDYVHNAVITAGDTEGGITIHYVNENYDEGEYIYQAKYRIDKGDNLEMIKFKGQQLEHQHYPRIVEGIIKKIKKFKFFS